MGLMSFMKQLGQYCLQCVIEVNDLNLFRLPIEKYRNFCLEMNSLKVSCKDVEVVFYIISYGFVDFNIIGFMYISAFF